MRASRRLTPARGRRLPQGWGQGRKKQYALEKQIMAEHFVLHDFLVRDGGSPEVAVRETAASILANPGTTPNAVVSEALSWMKNEWGERGPFSVTWYSGSALVAATLQDFKVKNMELRSAAELFLLPGPVDSNLESVLGDVPAAFLKQLDRHFTSLILGAHSFDMVSGTAYFHFSNEILFQQRCALLPARDKILFLDQSKFRKEGQPAYTMEELLSNCQAATIYTVAETLEQERRIVSEFVGLAGTLHMEIQPSDPGLRDAAARSAQGNGYGSPGDSQQIRLCLIRENNTKRVIAERPYAKGGDRTREIAASTSDSEPATASASSSRYRGSAIREARST